MDDRYDIVIFGATGFTGKRALEEVLKLCCTGNNPLTIAVAGRTKSKLQDSVTNATERTGIKIDIPIITADAGDVESLSRMAKKAKLVLNCCGPYVLYGEPVVKACIAEGTHHIDITGEPLYIQRLYLNYNDLAKERGVYVINACGYDCIPADMGVIFLQDHFPGTLHSVEMYHVLTFKDPAIKGAMFSMGTWTSLVHFLDNFFLIARLQRQITQRQKIPDCKPKLKSRLLPHRPPVVEKPSVLFPSWDKSAAEMTQAYLYHNENKRPVQTNVYFALASYCAAFRFMFGSFIWFLFSKSRCTSRLLINHPKFFTNGFVRREDISEEVSQNLEFRFTLLGKGWKDKYPDDNGEIKTPLDHNIAGRISGQNVYGITATMAALCAKVLLTESEKLPKTGGIYTTGAAFARTSLIRQLGENGVKFELINP